MKILIVDDSANIRAMIRSIIDSSDHQFFECEDGDISLSLCDDYHPDLILMDIKMKRMNGITATRMIKTKYPRIKIIMVTNFPYPDLMRESIAAGAERLLPKEELLSLPLLISELFKNTENNKHQ
ncbi:MAG: response regulator transcription factor [Ignavibacteriales bacterium]|nr:response regulator transcription factor [Ignavibacteriales bacterium]MCF8316572.1 response regulator transcription factor [Ignavibacteriales bacterium]MCF8437495.1 response regulator transcription factor [Ignavibacteriales bacterium]